MIFLRLKNRFDVINPPTIFNLNLVLVIFFFALTVFNTIFSEPPHHVMYICVTLMIYVPCGLAMIWTKRFRVMVDGRLITVRRAFLPKYSFDVSEIISVKWKTFDIKLRRGGENMRTESVKIKTAGKSVSVESLMPGFDEMAAYITANVDKSRIAYSYSSDEVEE